MDWDKLYVYFKILSCILTINTRNYPLYLFKYFKNDRENFDI